MQTWCEVGLSPEEFWKSTPRMIVARISAQRTCFERDHNGRAWLAWHIAALMRSNPKKPLPKLETMLALAPSVRRQQTPNEILAMVKMLNAAFGGTVKG